MTANGSPSGHVATSRATTSRTVSSYARMRSPLHGERMRAYEETVRDVVARDVATWPEGSRPRCIRYAAGDARVICAPCPV